MPSLGKKKSKNPAADFVDSLLQDELLPFIENYAIQELALAFNSPSALQCEPMVMDEEPNRPTSVGKFSNSMAKVLLASLLCHLLPEYQDRLEEMAQAACMQFLENIDAKIHDLALTNRGASTIQPAVNGADRQQLLDQEGFSAVSAVLANNENLRAILAELLAMSDRFDMETYLELAEKESILLEQLKSDRSLHRRELIFDPKVLRQLALLQQSLDHVLEAIENRFGNAAVLSPHRTKIFTDPQGCLVSEFFNKDKRSLVVFSSSFQDSFNSFKEAVNQLGVTCLYILRIEVRAHCFFYLDLAYREGNYELEEPVNEPESYVSSLASDLVNLESIIADWLPFSRYQYIKSINKNGCHKLFMNMAALDQVLSIISPFEEGNLRTVQDYYHLVEAGPAVLIEKATHMETKFNLSQYQAILDAYYRNIIGENEGARKDYQNQMIKLRYNLSDISALIKVNVDNEEQGS